MGYYKKTFPGLEHQQYEHPFDKKALERLEKIPGLTWLCEWITTNLIERIYSIQYTGSNLRVTKDSYPQIYRYLEAACQILDMKKIPELYLTWDYSINACTIGAQNPIVILNSGLIDLCDYDEIMFIVGHECGHLKSNHMLYHLAAKAINMAIDSIPGGSIVAGGLQYGLYYWNRMSEFTADRAGLLCCQNDKAMISSFMKMAGLPMTEFDKVNADSFIQQARDFKMLDYDNMNKVVKFFSIADETHPWTVMRAAELIKWMESSNYNDIIGMKYLK